MVYSHQPCEADSCNVIERMNYQEIALCAKENGDPKGLVMTKGYDPLTMTAVAHTVRHDP
jgi:hypothetical protein